MSLGNKVGRALGTGAALVVEGSIRGAQSLGSFGADVVTGAEQGYLLKSVELKAHREAAIIARDKARAKLVKETTVAIATVA